MPLLCIDTTICSNLNYRSTSCRMGSRSEKGWAMFSALKQTLKSRITHLIYDIAITRYEAQTWTRTMQCQHCQEMISIDAHFCMYCGNRVVAPTTRPAITQTAGESWHMDNIFHVPGIQIQDTEPISIDEVSALLSVSTATTRRFLQYARSHNGLRVSPLVVQHRQRQDREYFE